MKDGRLEQDGGEELVWLCRVAHWTIDEPAPGSALGSQGPQHWRQPIQLPPVQGQHPGLTSLAEGLGASGCWSRPSLQHSLSFFLTNSHKPPKTARPWLAGALVPEARPAPEDPSLVLSSEDTGNTGLSKAKKR